MKRFFIILGICFASIVVFFTGYLGIKFLKGDFNAEVILPENIVFEKDEYYLEDGQNITILISTTTENVTEKEVALHLSKNCRETVDKKHWTDGVIVIPKIAMLGEPFSVALVKDDSYASELDDVALTNWVAGGVSTIIATSKNELIAPATTTTYVDVPVYKTEVVIYNGAVENSTADILTSLEFSGIEVSSQNLNAIPNINAGEKFYVGLKFYPSASAFKYSKISSTNMLVAYKNQILQKLESLGLDSLYTELQDKLATPSLEIGDLIDAYTAITNRSGNAELTDYMATLASNYYKNLKYFNITEKNISTDAKVMLNGRVIGTNIYEYTAGQNLGAVEFYSYAFKKSGNEDLEFKLLEDGEDILQMLETNSQNGKVIKNLSKLNIVDVEVDTIELSGDIPSFSENKIVTIYAIKSGTNSDSEAFLNITLSNSNIADINLQNRIKNVGIRFEVKQGVNWVDASEIIKFKNVENYSTIVYDDNTYYRPYGYANYWEIYANKYVDGTFRIIVKYFVETGDIDVPYECTAQVVENSLPQFSMVVRTESLISWINADPYELKVINLSGVLNAVGEPTSITINQEYNLADNVNRELINQNFFTTIKYFIYTDDNTVNLSEYFATENSSAVEYVFNDGSGNIKYLYELSSSILKLKDYNKIPSVSVKAIFVTIKTDINGAPVKNGEKYEIVKYSAVKDNSLEKLSSKEFVFKKSLSTLTGKIEILDVDNAGIINDELMIAQNSERILSVTVNCPETEMFEQAIYDGEISLVAKKAVGTPDNYISYSNGIFTAGNMTYEISTKSVTEDVEVSIFIVYTISGANYLFPVTYTYIDQAKEERTLDKFTIVYNVNSTARFVVTDENGDEIDLDDIEFIKVTTETVGGDDTITQVYTIYFKDGTQLKIEDVTQLFENNILKVIVTNFLNKTGDDDWYITSDNALVASVDVEEKKSINFVGNGTAKVSLFLDGNLTIQDELVFNIQNDGYVSQYATYDNDGNEIYTFSPADSYESKTIVLNVNGDNGGKIVLQNTAQVNVQENEALFAMWYNLENKDKKLTFKIRLADNDSKEVYNSISSKSVGADLYLDSEFTLRKTLGQTVTLHLIYECNELNNISQKITLNVLWKTNVRSFKVFADGNEIQKDENDQYALYAGYGYTFQTEISDGKTTKTPYYYVLNEGNELEAIDTDSPIVKQISELFYFDDVDGQKQYQIYISDVSSDVTIGDLQHIIKIIVNYNIKEKDTIVNAGYRMEVSLSDAGTATVSLYDLFTRILGTTKFEESRFKIVQTEAPITLDGENLSIYYGGMSSITNFVIVNVTISYFEHSLNVITFIITPHNYEKSDASRIAQANGEKALILCAGDVVVDNMPTIIASQLGGTFSIDNESAFGEFVDNGKIIAPKDSLFVDTECYLIVRDSVGNSTKYRITVSNLMYPFVNLKFNGTTSAKDLDIYKLFEPLGKENLKEYYEQMQIAASDELFGGDSISLLGNSAVFNFEPDPNISFSMSLVEAGDVADFAEISENVLQTRVVGRENIFIHIILRYKNGRYTYNIPTIIKISQSQRLSVIYPYDDRELPANYGTDEYDSNNMLVQTTPFGNAVMEYVPFVSGLATVELSDDKFAVYVFDGANYIKDDSYNSGYNFEINKVYVKLESVWAEINTENLSQYATILGNVVTINRSGAVAIRVKIKVSSVNGGAENYYYVQAGELQDLRLYKHNGSSETGVNYQDAITVNTGDIIAINSTATGVDYKYYTKQFENYLNFEVIGDDSAFSIDTVNKTITILRTPNSQTIQVKVFTIYGEIATIIVNINAYYIANLKDIDIYSGTTLNVTDFVSVKNNEGLEIIAITLLENEGLVDTDYDVVPDGTYKVRFAHSDTDYTISLLRLAVEVEGYNFIIELEDVVILAGIVSNLKSTDVERLDDQTESNGRVLIEKEIWDELFVFNDLSKMYGVRYEIIYNGDVIETNKNSDESIAVGILTGVSDIDLLFRVVLQNFDGTIINIDANAKMKVQPQYIVTVNYPQAIDTEFKCEYIQAGSVVDLSQENFNGIPRIVLKESENNTEITNYTLRLKNASGNEAAGLSGTMCEINEMGSYFVEILYNGKLYGLYNLEVIGESPIGVDTTYVDGQTFYSGFGADDLFNYVDITLDIPTDMGDINTNDIFNFVAKKEDGTYIVLQSNVYYNSLESEKTYRLAISLEVYNQGVRENNIYVYYNNGTEFYALCKNVTISQRISANYYGEEIDSESISNVISTSGATITLIEDNRYSYSIEYQADIVANRNSSENKICGEFFIDCDFDIDLQEIEGVHLTMNANEFPEGISFVETFNLRDLFGKKFWYNHVGALGGQEATLSLSYKDASLQSSSCVLFEPDTVLKDSNDFVHDYKLKAMGADNDGTIVELVLNYRVGGVAFTCDIRIKVISDIVYSILNNDGYATPNSETNPLVISVVGPYKLVDSTQTTENNDEYYVWAYSKYSSTRKNVAQTLNSVISSSGIGYAIYGDSGNDKLFTFTTPPSFGDKNIIITFTDDYGFVFTYHITLVASVRMESITVTQESYYEKGIIAVYNKNDTTYNGELKGVSIDLRNNNGGLDTSKVIVTNLEIKSPKNVAVSEIVSSYGAQINLSNPAQDFWNYGNGSSVVVTFIMTIKKAEATETETCEITRSFVILKKYELSVKEENTYVRDGVEFNIEHLVSVYDYEINSYLAEPTLRTADAIKLDFTINESYTVTDESIAYNYSEGPDTITAIITLNSLNINDLMLARMSSDYLGISGSSIEISDGLTMSDDIADAILEYYGIKYSEGTFTLDIEIKAVNKLSGESDSDMFGVILNKESDDTFRAVDEENYLYLGETNSIFNNPSINKNDYYFCFNEVTTLSKCFGYTNNTPSESAPAINSEMIRKSEDSSGVDVEIAQFKTVYVLTVAVENQTEMLLKTDAGLIEYNVSTGNSSTYLQNNAFIDTVVELYTGPYKYKDGSYYIPANGEEDIKFAFNGFTLDSVREAKNIGEIFIEGFDDGEECILNLDDEKALSEYSNIKYQSIKTNLYLTYDSTNVQYTSEVGVRVTLKYTGVDVEGAYVGPAQIKRISFILADNPSISQSATNNAYIVSGSQIDIDISKWGEGFELVPGVGNTAIVAKYKEQDFTFDTNKDMLSFELVAVSNQEGSTKNNLVEISENGEISLLSGFNLSEYFITVSILCKYPNEVDGLSKAEEIARVYIGFKVV